MSLCVVMCSAAHSVRQHLVTYNKPKYLDDNMLHNKLKSQDYVHFSVFKFVRNTYTNIKELEPLSKNLYSAVSFIPKYKYLLLVMMKSTSQEKLPDQYILWF